MARHEPTAFDDAFEELLTKILTDREILVVVLRGHLVAEALVNDIYQLFLELGASKTQLSNAIDSNFKSKLDGLYAGEIIDDRCYLPLTALNRIRNSFAHLPLKGHLSNADEAAFLKSFSLEDQRDILNDSKDPVMSKMSHRTFRYGLLQIHAQLRVLVEFGREDGLRRFPQRGE